MIWQVWRPGGAVGPLARGLAALRSVAGPAAGELGFPARFALEALGVPGKSPPEGLINIVHLLIILSRRALKALGCPTGCGGGFGGAPGSPRRTTR